MSRAMTSAGENIRYSPFEAGNKPPCSRYLHACKSIWLGLPTFFKERQKRIANPCLNLEIETADMVISNLDVNAGFTLTNPNDPRYKKVVQNRLRFSEIVQQAASTLRRNTNGEDHIDAIIAVTRAIDTALLAYGLSRSDFDSMQKNYVQAREWVISLAFLLQLTISFLVQLEPIVD